MTLRGEGGDRDRILLDRHDIVIGSPVVIQRRNAR